MMRWVPGVMMMLVCVEGLDEVSRNMMQTIDPTPIINNKQLVQNFMDCFFDKKPCNPIAAQIKSNIDEVLKDGCESCGDTQKALISSVLTAFIPRYPDQWKEFLLRYDPQGTYWPVLRQNLGLDPNYK